MTADFLLAVFGAVVTAFIVAALVCEEHPDVRPWFHDEAEPGPYTEDPEDGYPYDE